MLYDIHCHLDCLNDIDQIIHNSEEAGINYILTQGTNVETNRKALELKEKYSLVDAALGIYPTDAIAMSEEEFQKEIRFIEKTNPTAIGEVGIDNHHDKEHIPEMKRVFEEFISLSERINKPLIIHSRKAEQEVIDLLESSSTTALLHCFGGSLKLAKRAAALGMYFSIPPPIVRSTHFQRLVEETPTKQLLLETDAPWMSPDENPNEPKHVGLVAKKIAEIKGLDEEETIKQLWMNKETFLR